MRISKSRRLVGAILAAAMFLIVLYKHLDMDVTKTSMIKNAQSIAPEIKPVRQCMTINQFGVCSKGPDHMAHLQQKLKDEFVLFLDVYKQRLSANPGGTNMVHQFALFSMIRHLRPAHIIESGVHNGLGTWMIRQAAPDAQLILMDPHHPRKYVDHHNSTIYLTGKKFKDFASVDWTPMNLDKDRTLIFFDDHQSGLKRTIQAKKSGFRHLMFDDNYDDNGDNFSLRKACKVYFNRSRLLTYTDNFGRVKLPLDDNDKNVTQQTIDNLIDIYYEVPTPWKTDFQSGFFGDVNIDDLKLRFSENINPKYFSKHYNYICYAKLTDVNVDHTLLDSMVDKLLHKKKT